MECLEFTHFLNAKVHFTLMESRLPVGTCCCVRRVSSADFVSSALGSLVARFCIGFCYNIRQHEVRSLLHLID